MALVANGSSIQLLSSSVSSTTKNFKAVALRSNVRGVSARRQLRSVRMESVPTGLGGTEVPLGGITGSVPLEQDPQAPVGKRIAYICQDCGYVYDQETLFQDQPDSYNCPVCSAPKNRFKQENAFVEDVLDVTKEDN
ncbi:hypothetical protein SELMODRAFT_443945 [Selaginella moellendorffii]|uniref:Rubredoxin-like domain-containing protein n=1 Tax=Selaginella moellendorffii TaxID=88036 RepID=D8S5R1_SELML|nr:uncharacterized protein LOC9653871 [Selaginella moellendorffii]EFJ20218.1 hypothetical protein SELMODRAFT_443945 [Selaginella moellendorffii]|eukprot:XP_002978771.1 uncharacterized protein LOC9653871 [Selaginella moellendorffii]